MPRKKTTASEAEPAAKTRAQVTAAVEPGDDVPKPRRKTPVKAAVKKPAAKKSAAKKPAAKKAAAKKAAVKKRAGGSKPKPAATANVPGEPAEGGASQTPGAVQAETTAQAADTFEDAFEANDTGEAGAETDSADPLAHAAAETGAERRQESSQNSSPESSQDQPPANQQRLQKILAAAGVASRRHAEQLIVEGRVEVNGQVVTTLGSKADPERDHIRVDGKLIHGAERQRYFMLNKPRGYVTTVSDPEGRPTVMQFFERMRERLYPVGRLDYLSQGPPLMTNDGELANKLTRAASGVEKIYLVKVAGQPDEDRLLRSAATAPGELKTATLRSPPRGVEPGLLGGQRCSGDQLRAGHQRLHHAGGQPGDRGGAVPHHQLQRQLQRVVRGCGPPDQLGGTVYGSPKIQGIPFPARPTARAQAGSDQRKHRVCLGTTEGLWKTTDLGKSWKRVSNPEVVVNDVFIDPRDSNHVLIATDRSGVMASTNGAATLETSNYGYAHRYISALVAEPHRRSRE